MNKKSSEDTWERIDPANFVNKEQYLIYLRFQKAYDFVKRETSPKSLILDSGCGEGYGSKILSEKGKVTGIDVDEDVIKKANEKYSSKKCNFQVYDGYKLPFKKNSFNYVVSFQVIEHIADVKNYLSEIKRVLKKNGKLIITTPNREYRLREGQKPWNPFHKTEYSSEQLKKILEIYFDKVEMLGIKGNNEIQNIEQKRVSLGKNISFYDPLRIRNLIPLDMKMFLLKLKKKVLNKEKFNSKNFLNLYSIEDFYLVSDNLNKSLDLLAICKKQ